MIDILILTRVVLDWGSSTRRPRTAGSYSAPSQPAQFACFELLELVSFGTGVEQNELRHGAIELPQLLGDDRTEDRANEGLAWLVAARQHIDSLEMLIGFRLHTADYRQLVH